MALFPVRVRIIPPAVCEEPKNSGRVRKRDYLITAAVYGGEKYFDHFEEKLRCLNAHFTVCIHVSPAIPLSNDTCGRFLS